MAKNINQTEKDIKNTENHRQYNVSISEEDRNRSFEIEDERWRIQNQLRDWMILGVMVLLTLGWNLFVYFMEAGLR